jgi:HPt (histidine-containing phosphotransfer) domain-containing protein
LVDTVGKPFTAKELWRCLIKYFKNENTSVVSSANRVSLPNPPNPRPNVPDAHELELKEMQRVFVKSNHDTFANIDSALESSDIKTAHRLVHSLRSNAGYIQETRLQKSCGSLEVLLAQGKAESLPKGVVAGYMDDIRYELEVIMQKLAHLSDANDDKISVSAELDLTDSDRIFDLFRELTPLLKKCNTDSLKYVEELSKIDGLGEFTQLIESYQFKQALSAIETISKQLRG